MDTDVFDVVVVGAGIMGSSTAYYLVNQGRKVLLLEQFRLPHTRGSSHGQSRGFRKAYPQKFYANMTDEALEAWNRLERESGTSLYRRTGLLVVGKKGSQCLEETDVTLKQTNCSHERLSHAQMTKRYPQFSYPDNYEGVLDHTAGILWASAAVLAYQTVFRCRGGVLNDGDKVLRIIPADISEVVTSRARYKTRSVIITAGPWTNKILKDLGLSLPLKTLRTYLPYWRVAPNGGMSIEDKSAPCMSEKIGPDADENYVYHSPSAEYPGHVKIALHDGPEADPENPDETSQDDVIGKLADYIRSHLPFVHAKKPSIVEPCMYTMTPDHHFVLDRHPRYRNIIIGAGFSGHGFKMAPVVGKVLGQLSLGQSPSYDLTPFRISRFPGVKSHL
ncbi:peroxisomal sarcosine oxidase-like [Liolophura sinensis]|uniref:peroxisomal sarcosine oxidase-like n=1 Tax=Liolophura sinensis TaxID=3198878 RepID=UPI0031595CF0